MRQNDKITQEELEYIGDMLRPDALDQHDNITLDELLEAEGLDNDPMRTAGVDALTPVDTFLDLQGLTSFITELSDDYES